MNGESPLDECAAKLSRFVRCDAAGDAQHDPLWSIRFHELDGIGRQFL